MGKKNGCNDTLAAPSPLAICCLLVFSRLQFTAKKMRKTGLKTGNLDKRQISQTSGLPQLAFNPIQPATVERVGKADAIVEIGICGMAIIHKLAHESGVVSS